MRLLMRFMRPYRGLIAVTLLVLLIDNVGTLLVPTMLANMVNTGITTGDVDYILRNGLYMLIATGMASGGAVLGCYLSARLAANVACDIRNAVYDKSLELSASDFERFGTGSMITRSLNDINVIQQAILQTIQLGIRMESISVIRNRRKKPKSFLMRKQERKRKQSSIPRRHRFIRQMKERVLERRNPV